MSTGFPSIDAGEDLTTILTDGTYCSVKWSGIWNHYNYQVHEPLILAICILGCVTNALNLFVFTRQAMRNPTNVLLSVLSAADLLCVFRKAIDVSLTFHRRVVDERTSYRLHVENRINEVCFYLFHTWSIYMTLAVALWRLFGILRPMQSLYWFSYKSATLVCALFLGFATLLVPLLYIESSIELRDAGWQYNDEQPINSTYDAINTNDSIAIQFSHEQEYFEDDYVYDPYYNFVQTDIGQSLLFWINGLVIKLIPCSTLIICTVLLIMSLRTATKKRLALFEDRNLASKKVDRSKNNISDGVETVRIKDKRNCASSLAAKESAKTTKMLIILLIVFLVTELPPGVLAFSFGFIKSNKFFMQCYMPIRSFMNLNEYISSSVGFFIYVTMTSKFRQTFFDIFRRSNRRNNGKLSLLSIRRLFSRTSNESKNNVSPTTTEEMYL